MQRSDSTHEHDVTSKQLQELLKNWPVTMLGSVAAIAAAVFVYYGHAPETRLFPWVVAAFGINLTRWIYWLHVRRALRTDDRPQRHIQGFSLLSAADSSCWGAIGWLFFIAESPSHLVFLVALLVGVTSAGQVLVFAHLRTALIHPVLVMSPLAVMLSQQGDDVLSTMAGLVFVFILILAVVGARSSKSLQAHWQLQTQLATRDRELTAAQTFLQHLLDAVPSPIFVKDRAHRWIAFNDAFCGFIGRSREEMIGRSDDDFHSRDIVEAFWQQDDEVMQTGEVKTRERAFTDREGRARWALTRKTAFDLPSGERYLVGVITDVSELKEAHNELEQEVGERRRVETRLRMIADNLPAVVAYVDRDERYQFVNKSMEEWFDRSADELLGRTVAEVLGPTTYEEIRATIDRAFDGQPSSIEFSSTLADGTPRAFSSDIIPHFGADQDVEGYYVLTLDVTERRRAEEALRASESRLRAVYESAKVGIALADVDGRIEQCNPAFETMLGYGPSELIGKTFVEITHPDDVTDDADMFAGLKVGALDGYHFEKRYVRKDGSTCWVDLQGSALRNADEEFEQTLSVVKDVSAQKDAVEKLRLAISEAERANQAKSEFLAMMSHELRTPLHGILGVANLMRRMELAPGLQEYVQRIKASGDGLLSLLNTILDLSKIENGGFELEETDFRLEKVLDSVVGLLGASAEQKGLALRVDASEAATGWLKGDPERLRQILFNLVGNAIKFTDAGGVSIRVASAVGPDQLHEIRFEITDTGMGILPEQQQRIFDRFAQADGSATRKHGGTGLGLAISKELAQLMGGAMGVESEPGAGSTFWFTVRCRQGDEQASGVAASGQAFSGDGGDPGFGPLRVLVAEDNPVNQMIATQLLESSGHYVDVAANGLEALAAMAANTYDLVLMDISMPEMDGLTAARKIRALPGEAAKTPIIALTANAMAGEREKYLAAGMSDYLSKPFEVADLFGTIKRCLDAA